MGVATSLLTVYILHRFFVVSHRTVTSAGSVCSCQSLVDLTLVLDSSTTVRDWPAIKEFAVSVVDWFDVGQSRARVGVVVVGGTSSVAVRLDQLNDDRQTLYSTIRDMAHAGGPRSVPTTVYVIPTSFSCSSAYYRGLQHVVVNKPASP